jgi:lipocalin-like protein
VALWPRRARNGLRARRCGKRIVAGRSTPPLDSIRGSVRLADPRQVMTSTKLIGSWRLVSWQVIVEGQAQELFGAKPKGSLILTPNGRAIVLTTAELRTFGETDAHRAALHKSMLAYTGRYRVEGDEFITTVEISWNEAWNGTEQRRKFRLEGDTLIIESAPGPSFLFPGKTDFRRIVWRREM